MSPLSADSCISSLTPKEVENFAKGPVVRASLVFAAVALGAALIGSAAYALSSADLAAPAKVQAAATPIVFHP